MCLGFDKEVGYFNNLFRYFDFTLIFGNKNRYYESRCQYYYG